VDDSGSVFGRADLAAIAKGFGLCGANVTDVNQFGQLFEPCQAVVAVCVEASCDKFLVRCAG
jgi:hypothetical protein